MKKKLFAMGLAAVLALSLLVGCTGKQQNATPDSDSPDTDVTTPAGEYTGGPAWGKPASKMAVNFEGRVAAVEEGCVTLEDGTIVYRWRGDFRSRWQRRGDRRRRLHPGLCGRPQCSGAERCIHPRHCTVKAKRSAPSGLDGAERTTRRLTPYDRSGDRCAILETLRGGYRLYNAEVRALLAAPCAEYPPHPRGGRGVRQRDLSVRMEPTAAG